MLVGWGGGGEIMNIEQRIMNNEVEVWFLVRNSVVEIQEMERNDMIRFEWV